MASNLTCDLRLLAEWLFQDTGGGLSTPNDAGEIRADVHLSYGSLAKQVEKRWWKEIELAASATLTLDLRALAFSAGGLTGTISFDVVKLIVVQMTTDVAGIQPGGGGAAEWLGPWGAAGSGQLIGPGSPALIADLVDGWEVTVGEKDLEIVNASATDAANFKILIVGN